MGLYLCLECKNIYNSKYVHFKKDKGGDIYCPSVNCDGAVFEIDELLIQPVIYLNDKGYDTGDLSSGHVYEPEYETGYIKFYSSKFIPSTCPEGWYIHKNTNSIRYTLTGEPFTKERLHCISTAMTNLLDWCNTLPNRIGD